MSKTIVRISHDAETQFTETGVPVNVKCLVEYSNGTTEELNSTRRVREVMNEYQAQVAESLQPKTLKTLLYLHGSKESNYETAGELGLSDEASRQFAYTCYEVTVTLEIDRKTGKAKATHFEGVKLETPVEV
jgi:hypothetical protein